MGKGGGSNKKQIKKQYEYDTNKWEYDYDQMKLNEAYNESAFNIKVHNADQTRNIKNQSAKNEWLDKEKMRTFKYRNQVEDYNASDFFVSNSYDKGRLHPKSEFARRIRKQASVTYSETFTTNTTINGLSSFNITLVNFKNFNTESGINGRRNNNY